MRSIHPTRMSKDESGPSSRVGTSAVVVVCRMWSWRTLVSFISVMIKCVASIAEIACVTLNRGRWSWGLWMIVDRAWYSNPFSDCPFEEHASIYPFCDYIMAKIGLSETQRMLSQPEPSKLQSFHSDLKQCQYLACCLASLVKQTSVVRDGLAIKIIRFPRTRKWMFTGWFMKLSSSSPFDHSASTPTKNQRPPAARVVSVPAPSPSYSPIEHPPRSYSTTASPFEAIDEGCHICYENAAAYLYAPCQHFPMCESCFGKLSDEQKTICSVCRAKADICRRVAIDLP